MVPSIGDIWLESTGFWRHSYTHGICTRVRAYTPPQREGEGGKREYYLKRKSSKCPSSQTQAYKEPGASQLQINFHQCCSVNAAELPTPFS